MGQSTSYDIPYAEASPLQVLDLYLPTWTPSPAPLVMWFHGGGWHTGDKKSIAVEYDPDAPPPPPDVVQVQAPDVDSLSAKGYAVAAVNYRIDDDPVAAVRDAKAAVRFLRGNAAVYHLDPDRFAAWGDSAGAYSAIMLGVTGGQRTKFDDPTLGNPDVPADVQAVVDWFGPTDPDVFTYIRAGKPLPPFMIAHGDADTVIPLDHSRRLHAALSGAGARATLTVVPGAHHEDPAFMRTQLTPAVAFLDQALA